jgi:hypothetical protein
LLIPPSSDQGTSQSVNCNHLAAPLLTVAAGYRVSGFVLWHTSEDSGTAAIPFLRDFCRPGAPVGTRVRDSEEGEIGSSVE